MAKELSKRTIAIFLVLAIVLSVFITLIALNNRLDSSEVQGSGSSVQSAKVSLTVKPPEPIDEPNINEDVVERRGR